MNKKNDEKTEKTEEYSFDDKTVEEKIDEKIRLEEEKRTEEGNIHILDIAKNPPEQGYMKVDLHRADLQVKDEYGNIIKKPVVAMPTEKKEMPSDNEPKDPTFYINCNDEIVQVFDPIFSIDLKEMFEAQVSDCASTIFPMILDEAVTLALDEKKARMPEKRKEEFKWWWVIVLALIFIPILLITINFLPGF